MNGIELITAERQRQIEVEGWTQEHDDKHTDRDLAAAGVAYAIFASLSDIRRTSRRAKFDDGIPSEWPWVPSWWKPGNDDGTESRILELSKAGALIAAEIDRLQRAAAKESP